MDLIANQLHEMEFRRMQPKSLKPKHVDALVSLWKDSGLSVGTLKNRLSALRWWAKKVGKANVIADDNGIYGIGRRKLVAETSKARAIDPVRLHVESLVREHILPAGVVPGDVHLAGAEVAEHHARVPEVTCVHACMDAWGGCMHGKGVAAGA